MIDWQPYGPIYTVSPGIKKINDLPIIEFDDQEERYLKLKTLSQDNIFFDKIFSPNHEKVICDKIDSIIKKEYPNKKKYFDSFIDMGYSIQEDVAIFHRSNKLIALHVSFPSGWIPKEKIGLSFASIHRPVPGMESFLKNENKYVEMMVEATTPIIRYVWGQHHGYFLSKHEPLAPEIKVMLTERQTFVGIPEEDIGIFLIRKKVMLYEDTSPDFKVWYTKMLETMTKDQKKYKLED